MGNQWIMWSMMGAAFVGLLSAAYFGYLGLRSLLRPLMIFLTAWGIAIRGPWVAPVTALGLGLVIAAGAGLQILFTAFPAFDERTLLIASIVWQAVMATAIAALAVPLHLYIIHDVFAARRFGAETPFYRGEAVNQSLHARPPRVSLLVYAAALGLFIWVLSYGLHVAFNALIISTPGPARLVALYGTMLASFLILTPLSLVRPALSLGSKGPLRAGLAMAFRHAWGLYLMTALLLIAPAIVGPISVFVPRQFLPTSDVARAVATGIFLIFSVFQVMAVEAATLLLMNRAQNLSGDPSAPALEELPPRAEIEETR